MRVFSPDYTINASYENSLFCVIDDEANKEYMVGVRNNNLTGYLPLATYSNKEDAVAEIRRMATTAISAPNSNYVIKK